MRGGFRRGERGKADTRGKRIIRNRLANCKMGDNLEEICFSSG